MPDLSREEYLEQLVALLEKSDVFSVVADVHDFASRAEFRFYEQGAKVIRQGERGDTFFILMSGQLRAIDMKYDPPRLLNYIAPGTIFGTRAIFENTVRAATVEVVLDARVAVFRRDDWDWLIHQNDRFEAYCRNIEREFDRPSRIDFPGRQWDEVVAIWVKRHFLALLAKLSFPLILLIAPILFLIGEELLGLTFVEIFTDNLVYTLLATMPFILLSAVLAAYHYLDWRNDDFIVTTKRVVHIERVLLYGEQRDEAPLTRIQDVTVITHDILSKFFDYNDLHIKTAGAGVIKLEGIPEAGKLRDTIFRERGLAQARITAADLATIRQKIAGTLAWEEALEKPVLEVIGDEAVVEPQEKTRYLPMALEYLIPRMKEVTEEDKGTVIVWRKHYFVLLIAIFFPVLALLLSIYFFIASFFAPPPLGSGPAQLVFAVTTIASLMWYAWRYDGWRKDVYMVTDTRIIDIEGTPFRLRGEKRREGTFDNIQNITYNIPTFFSQLLNMGDVVIETAGTEATFTFKKIFNPSGVQEEVFNRMVRFQQRQREKARDSTTDRLVEVIAEYHRLHEKTSQPGPAKS